VVEDAGTASADTVQELTEAGGEVEAVREVRPSFEEVFGALVERDRLQREGANPDARPEATEAA
jgi:hypothetical protein